MVQDTWPWHRVHAQHSHQKLPHCSPPVTPTPGLYLQGALVRHLRQSTAHSIKQLVCCCKAQPRPGSCTWSPKAYKTDLNPEFASLAFCPYTCVPVIVPLPTAGCKDSSDGLCISLASKAQCKLNFLHWACKNADHLSAAQNLGTNMNKMAADAHSCTFSCMPPSILKAVSTSESSFQRFSWFHNLRLQETNNKAKGGDCSHKARNTVLKKNPSLPLQILCNANLSK